MDVADVGAGADAGTTATGTAAVVASAGDGAGAAAVGGDATNDVDEGAEAGTIAAVAGVALTRRRRMALRSMCPRVPKPRKC